MDPANSDFIRNLREEKLHAQGARNTLTVQKLGYATALLGLGSLNIKIGQFDLGILAYLIPWVALAFDLYIMGEDYSVKRLGNFLKTASSDPLEQRWENWVAKNRDPFSPWAMPVLTTLVQASSVFIISSQNPAMLSVGWFWAWLGVTLSLTWLLFFYYRWLRGRIASRTQDLLAPANRLSAPAAELARVVRAQEHLLNQASFEAICRFYRRYAAHPAFESDLAALMPEYGRPEYLLCVTHSGEPLAAGADLLRSYRALQTSEPALARWFEVAELPGANGKALLAARWLHHLAGLRHRTVQLFIDDAALEGCTLVQVRGANKAEAPGCFDIPVAGHVDGVMLPEDALRKELKEELGLDPADLDSIELVAGYDYVDDGKQPGFQTAEFRLVSHSRLRKRAVGKLTLGANEVAALAVFSREELAALIRQSPERFATGICLSLPFLK